MVGGAGRSGLVELVEFHLFRQSTIGEGNIERRLEGSELSELISGGRTFRAEGIAADKASREGAGLHI